MAPGYSTRVGKEEMLIYIWTAILDKKEVEAKKEYVSEVDRLK